MRRCWIAAKADYRPCLSSCTQHRDQWMRPTGECAHKIFFKNLNPRPPRLRIASVGHCHQRPPSTTKCSQAPPMATAHRPQGVTVPLHWFAGCPSPLVPRCGVPGASGVRPATAPAMLLGNAAPAQGSAPTQTLDTSSRPQSWEPAHAAGPACRDLLPSLERHDLTQVARHPAAADTLPARRTGFNVGTHRARERTAVRGLARSSTGAASPFARCVSCPPCSRKFS